MGNKTLMALFDGFKNHAERTAQPRFGSAAPQVVEEWALAQFLANGLAMILGLTGDEQIAGWMRGRTIGSDPTDVDAATASFVHATQENHPFYIAFILAAAAHEHFNRGHGGWRLVREAHTRSLQTVTLSGRAHDLAEALYGEIWDVLPADHPARNFLALVKNRPYWATD